MFYMANDEKAFDRDISMIWSYAAEAFFRIFLAIIIKISCSFFSFHMRF